MKRITAVFVAVLLAITTLAYAQTATTIHAQWTPNPASDNITAYQVTIDNNTPYSVAPTVDPTCSCIQTAFNVLPGSHTIAVAAQNLLLSTDPLSTQTGTPLVITFKVSPAGVVTGGKVVR